MEIMIKIAAAAVISSILALLIKKNSPEISLMLITAVMCIIMYGIYDVFDTLICFINDITEITDIPPAVPGVMLKTCGIAITAKLTSDVCSDAGQKATATAVELAGCAAAVYTALPLISTMLEMLNTLW